MNKKYLAIILILLILVGALVALFLSGLFLLGPREAIIRTAPPALHEPATVIETKVGKEISIILDSNKTTGYEWQVAQTQLSPVQAQRKLRRADFLQKENQGESAQPDSGGILQAVSSDYICPNTELVGAPGKEKWVFKALKRGRVALSFVYVRPWEKDQAPALQKIFIVVVSE